MKPSNASEQHNLPTPPEDRDTEQFTTSELPILAEESAQNPAGKADSRTDYTTRKLPVISPDEELIDPTAMAEQPSVSGDAQVAADIIARLTRRAEASELDRAALEERIRMLQRRSTILSRATAIDSLIHSPQRQLYWLRELVIALALGLALLALIDYMVVGDTIPLLPESMVEPATAAPALNFTP